MMNPRASVAKWLSHLALVLLTRVRIPLMHSKPKHYLYIKSMAQGGTMDDCDILPHGNCPMRLTMMNGMRMECTIENKTNGIIEQ